MSAVQRVGDSDSGGGSILQGVNSVRVNGIPISVNGNPVSGHGLGEHGGPKTRNTQSSVRAANIPVIKTGDADTCGDSRVGGSPNVRVGG